MVDELGKSSEFNWAALFVRSLDEQVGYLSFLNLDLKQYDHINQKYNYEIATEILFNLFAKLSGHLSKEELSEGHKYRKLISDTLEFLPPFKTQISRGLTGNSKSPVFNQKNYKMLKDLMFDFQLKLLKWIEVHKLGTPEMKDATKSVVDL